MQNHVYPVENGFKGCVIAVVSTGLTVWVRILLDPWLNHECPFSLFYLSVLLTAWLSGPRPAILAIILGSFFATYFFIHPVSSFALDSVSEIVQLVMYFFVNCIAVLLFNLVKHQRGLAEERSQENELLNRSLREADVRKDEFLALLAHELRNPLAPIRTGLIVLNREPHSAETTRRIAAIIERQTNHLTRITDDLLDTSRFCHGKVELQITCMDLRDAIEDAIEMTTGQFEEKAHAFQKLIPNQPVWVEGDRLRLAQLTANLLGNAAKYTPPGGRIVLDIEQTSATASIVVRDNGIGFPPEETARIMLPFMQMDTSRTREYGGLGLGLTIVSRLAELHSGSLSAQSRGPGRGSCFTVKLPTVLAPATVVPKRELDSSQDDYSTEIEYQSDNVSPKHVLIVEDSPDAAELLQELLESEGFKVSIAKDGVDALQIASQSIPDICICDIGLPGMDGYEVARRIRRMDHGDQTFLIALTGWGSTSDRQLSMEAGFDLHQVKPIIYSELLQNLTRGKKSNANPLTETFALPESV